MVGRQPNSEGLSLDRESGGRPADRRLARLAALSSLSFIPQRGASADSAPQLRAGSNNVDFRLEVVAITERLLRTWQALPVPAIPVC